MRRTVPITIVLLVLAGCGKPPQMGSDEETFATVDALFTAVTARDVQKLAECERRLHELRDAGKLPKDAAEHLDGIMRKARGGGWESAAERLYAFMREQRREGHPPRAPKAKTDRTG
jgi:hypothetical protein